MISDGREWMVSRVSRETMDRLEIYRELLVKWQKTVNLVAPSTLEAAWTRHFADSAQLWDHAPDEATHWLDLGSGGGFPGLVIAVLARDMKPGLRVTLVESDVRKCGFLREAARRMGVDVGILSRRIADIPPQCADVISARALSSLENLIALATPHLSPIGVLLLPKGANHQAELETLPQRWQSTTEKLPSLTDPTAVILRIKRPNPSEPD